MFWATIISVALVYLLLKLAFPYFAMVVTGKENPLPMPLVAMLLYMIITLMGAYIYVTASKKRRREFLRPILRFLRGDVIEGIMGKVRMATLILIPISFGLFIFSQFAPKIKSPTGIRIQHPTMPSRFEGLNNPFRNPTDEMVKEFIQKENLKNVSMDEARKALVQKYIEEGIVLFEKNCRPCHGVVGGGDGPMADGFRLKPADFRDPGTIATVVESFALWRVNEGGRGLPNEATPWDSAMPIWKNDSTEKEMWKIILAEYDIAGKEPRIPEK